MADRREVPIDTSAIAATGASIRSIVKEIRVNTAPLAAWEAWTSDAGIAAWWGPPATRIDLRIGGPFELLFAETEPEGSQGSEGCRYLAYVPGEMVAFTWNAPPHLTLRSSLTWVVITFTPNADGSSGVRLVHTGFLEGADWDEYMAYFEDAWGRVLRRMEDHFDTGAD